MKNFEKFKDALQKSGYKTGDTLSAAEFIACVKKHYPDVPETSILPADYCNNHQNQDPHSGRYHLFRCVPEKYKVL